MPIVGGLKGQMVKFASKYYFTNIFFQADFTEKSRVLTDQYTHVAMHYDRLF